MKLVNNNNGGRRKRREKRVRQKDEERRVNSVKLELTHPPKKRKNRIKLKKYI